MANYSYAECLQRSYRVNWKIRDVIADRRFDPALPWLPSKLSGSAGITCLDPQEKLRVTHVEMGSYAHIFGYVEEFIAPKMTSLAMENQVDRREIFDALANFSAEEIKHMTLFRELRAIVDQTLGFPLLLLSGEKDVARFVLGKRTGSVLLLISCIEWLTQMHYVSAIRDEESVDPFTKEVFRCHWLEESQHAQMDYLEALRAFDGASDEERSIAADELVELLTAIDGLLQKQAGFDVLNVEKYLSRSFPEAEKQEIYQNLLGAKRWAFIESGVTHPNFQEIFGEVLPTADRERVHQALDSLMQATTLG